MLNGDNDEDKKGEYTQTSRGCTVIDYALTPEAVRERTKMRIGTRIASDHEPIEIRVNIGWTKKLDRKIESRKIADWSEEATEKFKEQIKDRIREETCESLDELKEVIRKETKYRTVRTEFKQKEEAWWNSECTFEKKKLQKKKREFKKEQISHEELKEAERRYKAQIEKSKREYSEAKAADMENCKGEKDFWKIIGKKKEGVSKNISKEEWYEFFKKSYEGSESRKVEKRSEKRIGLKEKITKEKIRAAVRKLKKKKQKEKMESRVMHEKQEEKIS